MAVLSPYAFCDQDDIETILSVAGAQLRIDEDMDGVISAAEERIVPMCVSDAAETMMYYCSQKYTPEMMATSPWVSHRASWYACYVLCSLRANPVPESILGRLEAIQKELEEVRSGPGLIPNLPLRMRLAPTVSNSTLDVRFQYKCIRIDPQTSTRPSGKVPQHIDYNAAYTFEL